MHRQVAAITILTVSAVGISIVGAERAERDVGPMSTDRGDWKFLAERLLGAEGIRTGLCVHIDCGEGALTAELGLAGRLLVHGLTARRENVIAGREYIRSQGIYGRVSINHCPFTELPYADNLVNVLIVDDPSTLRESDLTVSEIMRVVAPLGTVWLREAGSSLEEDLSIAGFGHAPVTREGGWARIVKPWPDGMDEWPQFRHDASRAAMSDDRFGQPCTSLRWIAGDRWAHRSLLQAVSANGRNFYLVPNDEKRLREPPGFTVTARDAFNGLLLWQRHGSGPLNRNCRSPLVAGGDKLFTYLGDGGSLVALDAATGDTVKQYSFHGPMVTYHRGMLIVGQGARAAYDAETGSKLWDGAWGYDPCVIDGDSLFLATKTHIVCLDVNTGEHQWEAPFHEQGERHLQSCRDGILLFAGYRSRTSGRGAAYSAKDGTFLWSHQFPLPGHGGRPDIWLVGGLAWVHKGAPEHAATDEAWVGLDPHTGAVRQTVAMPEKVKHRCYPHRATEKYILGGGMDFFDVGGEKVHAFHGARGACGFGYFPANGLIYAAPTLCECFAHIRGQSAFAADPTPTFEARTAADISRLEMILDVLPVTPVATTDWPTHRHDPSRSASTSATVPSQLRIQWTQRISESVSAPVIAGGQVYVASPDTHCVVALEAESGQQIWRFTAGGPVDSPPTIAGGVALFGCRDGWVYAVSADKGQLAWRFRAAPVDRHIVSRGHVESVWPVHGSVLVLDNTVFFAAGRQSEVDGGIFLYAVDVRSGEIAWQRQVVREHLLEQTSRGAIGNEMNDILTSDGKSINMYKTSYEISTGQPCDPTSDYLWGGTTGWIDDMTVPPYGWKHEFQRQRRLRRDISRKSLVAGSVLVRAGDRVFGLNNDRNEIFCSTRRDDRVWTTTTSAGDTPKAILHAGNFVFVAAARDGEDSASGELRVYSDGDGQLQTTLSLPSRPSFDGMAAVEGALCVATQDGNVICLTEK
jgi:outer membrane protein assembly factor BamB